MLILLSDLHFMDGTAGVDNLDHHAFERMLHDMADRARDADAQEVRIALLGDIFDLIRTERWFDVPQEQRPWGRDPSEQEAIATFDAIVERNRETFEILSGPMGDRFEFPAEPEIVYVPGNHDRLCNLYPSLRRRAREALGMPDGDELFPTVLLDPPYGVYGRHGHEFDPYNFEGTPVFGGLGQVDSELDAYLAMPIGDVIASEFASKLPVLVRERVDDRVPQGESLVDKFRELFDVRPLAAIVDWLGLQRARQPEPLEEAINGSMRQAAEEFQRIPFVSDWINKHDDWRDPLDDADKLEMLFGLLRRMDFTDMKAAAGLAKSGSEAHEAHYPEMAQRDFSHLDTDPDLRERILYVVYGHTHTPQQAPVGVIGDGADERHRVYINTGTWRPSHRHARDDSGFVSWNNLTVTYLYKPGERTADGRRLGHPAFETWTGAFC